MLGIVGLYSLYLRYIGLGEGKAVQPDKLVGYHVVTLAIGIVVFVVIMAITTPSATYSGSAYFGIW